MFTVALLAPHAFSKGQQSALTHVGVGKKPVSAKIVKKRATKLVTTNGQNDSKMCLCCYLKN